MSAEIPLTTAQTLVGLLRESFSMELRPPINYKEYGRIGYRAPYSLVVRREVVRDFLQSEVGLKPDEVDKAFVFVIGEKPHKIPDEDMPFAFPPELRDDPRAFAYIHEHPTLKIHCLDIPAFRLWADLRKDRDLIIQWTKRKQNMQTAKSWETLGRKTQRFQATEERRLEIEKTQTREELEIVIANILSKIGTEILVEHAVHEVDHSDKFRKREDLWWFTKPTALKNTKKIIEDSAEKAELELAQKWYHMLDFVVNPRKPRTRKVVKV